MNFSLSQYNIPLTYLSTFLIVSLVVLSGAEVESKNKEKTIQVTADKEETILSLDEKTTLELTDDPDEFIIEDVD